MIVILIISLLAALVLGVASVAGETAREQHSRHVVERLHTLLIDYYNTYKTRRARLNPNVEKEVRLELGSGPKVGLAMAEARLYAMREMMLMDIPDRWSDVLLQRIEDFNPSNVFKPLYLSERTQIVERLFAQISAAPWPHERSHGPAKHAGRNPAQPRRRMPVHGHHDRHGRRRSPDAVRRKLHRRLRRRRCAGVRRRLEAPHQFPPLGAGYISQIQMDMKTLSTKSATASTEIAKDHDPFDMFRVDPNAFRLVPLIYSPGRNEDSGIYVGDRIRHVEKAGASIGQQQTQSRYLEPRLTPYELDPAGKLTSYLGTSVHLIDPSLDETSTDNITNHLLGLR